MIKESSTLCVPVCVSERGGKRREVKFRTVSGVQTAGDHMMFSYLVRRYHSLTPGKHFLSQQKIENLQEIDKTTLKFK